MGVVIALLTALAIMSPAAPRTTPTVHRPPGAAVFDYQLGGSFRPARDVRIVDRDRTDPPAPGRYNICYVNAFQTEPGERSWWLHRHPHLVLRDGSGRPLVDPGWPDEYLLDTSTAADRNAIASIVGAWFTGCARHGYAAVEPDNLDSWTRSRHRLTRADNVALARLLVARAHRAHLAIAQKNTVEVVHAHIGFDFAIAEECQVYGECAAYRSVYGSRVYEVEYTRRAFRAACASHAGKNSIILRDLDVTPHGQPGYVSAHC